MASNTHTITVIEHCQVSLPPNTVAENSMPLTFFDLMWLNLSPFSRVLFYDFNGTRTDFSQNLVPKLKTSLSLALQHYFPLAANLVTPTTYNSTCISTKPTIRYLDGDSVSLTVAEYNADFIRLTGNQSRDIDELSCLAPRLSPAVQEHSQNGECEVQVSPVLAIQVTYFPGQGICVGITNSHAVADGSTLFNFIRAWGSIAKCSFMDVSDDALLENCSKLFKLPFHDRSVIKDPKGLAGMYISQRENHFHSHVPPVVAPAPAKKVRATFVLAQTNIDALKKLVSTKLPRLPHLSSLTVACGYIWSCLAKTRKAIDSNEEDEEEHLMIAVDCRARLDPPIPETYFGNCITSCLITTTNSQLVGEPEGFIRATELISESIHKKLNGGILEGAEMWYEDFKVVKTKWKPERVTGIAGSPKFYFYDIDFGWGRPRKYEFISQKMSITRRTDVVGDMEVGLCLNANEMHYFPFAGNLVTPTTYNDSTCVSTKPAIRYLDGESESVSLTVAEYDADLARLTVNQARDFDELSCLAPQLPPAVKEKLPDGSTNTNENAPLDSSRLFNLPFLDRSIIKDQKGLADTYISQMGDNYSFQTPATTPTKKVGATFMLRQTEIEALKKLVSAKLPGLSHLSSFTVACGICFITTNNSQLGGEGFIRAAELIGESIHKKLNGGILKGAEMWYEDFKSKTNLKLNRTSGIAGSPKFYLYDIDFGWGKPRKYECISQKLSISGCRDARYGIWTELNRE
ncbi:hypothetical protein POM88_012324 [Heracleum sosnowskyi]|uniref:Uncharacterized protein n=1 Tax=Heracleum sosnowskyi TaxID=360622 RepID=A0AAD8IYG1_9APIA|nr:hypothetical protein POM88_012324 [Heracleum sosnowskyi]